MSWPEVLQGQNENKPSWRPLGPSDHRADSEAQGQCGGCNFRVMHPPWLHAQQLSLAGSAHTGPCSAAFRGLGAEEDTQAGGWSSL